MTERSIFLTALDIDDPVERAAYVARACAGDADLRGQVEGLLAADRRHGEFMRQPAPDLVATIDRPAAAPAPCAAIGPYKLLEQIGEGGFGVVFMAEQLAPVRRKVALKVLKPGMDTRQVVGRFEAERQALAIMDHPNIARIFDAGATPAGRPYFVMELVKGVPITEFCDRNHLPPRRRLELFLPVCQAVQHAHQKGIIHRDLKPSNILVVMHDTTPVPKVIDFGIAKALGQELTDRTLFTGFAQLVGTPLYMSPEQAGQSGLDVDTRSDIYSLGVLLYELLTGTTPFDKERFQHAGYDEICRIIREEEPVKPSTRISTLGKGGTVAFANRQSDPRKLGQVVRGELDWIVMKCLEKDRSRRYETANSLATDVGRYLADEPVQACPPSAGYRFRKFARRNKKALATASVLATAVLTAVCALTVSNARIGREVGEKTKALVASQESLRDALAAVDRMLTRVSEDHLQYVPQMEPVRRNLLEDALEFYRGFLRRWGDDPAIRREVGLAYLRMGGLHHRLGDYPRSEEAYRRGFAMLDELGVRAPLEPHVRNKLIAHHIEFAWTLENQGKDAEREKALERAVAVADQLREEFPDVPSYRDWLVDASNRLAGAMGGGKPAEAEAILRRNLGLTEHAESPWHRAQTYQKLGILLAGQHRDSEAEVALREGVRFFEQALANSPSLIWAKGDLASTLAHLARAVDVNGRPQEAEEVYRRAIPMLDEFARDFPSGPHYRWGGMHVRSQHAGLLRKLGRPAEAEREYRVAAELAETLADDFPALRGYRYTAVYHRLDLARFLAESGRAEDARQICKGVGPRLAQLAATERSKALKARGHVYASLEDWRRAAADFTEAMELGSGEVLAVWCALALVELGAGRTDEYRSVCEKILARPQGYQALGILGLAPDAVADLGRPVRIAEELVAREPGNPGYLTVLGVALYRKGDLEAAARRLEASLGDSPASYLTLESRLILAMAYHRLGRTSTAERLFQEATRTMKAGPAQREGGGPAGMPPPWAIRLGLQLLHREALEVLAQGAGPGKHD